MGKYTINEVNKDHSQNHDQATANIVDILLITCVLGNPGMINNSLNKIVHQITSGKSNEASRGEQQEKPGSKEGRKNTELNR